MPDYIFSYSLELITLLLEHRSEIMQNFKVKPKDTGKTMGKLSKIAVIFMEVYFLSLMESYL